MRQHEPTDEPGDYQECTECGERLIGPERLDGVCTACDWYSEEAPCNTSE